MIRIRIGSNRFAGSFNTISYADFLGGPATPLIDAVNSQIVGLDVFQPLCANGYQALFQANTSGYSAVTVEPVNSGCGVIGLPSFIEGSSFVNTGVVTNGSSGQFYYRCVSLAAPHPSSSVLEAVALRPVDLLRRRR